MGLFRKNRPENPSSDINTGTSDDEGTLDDHRRRVMSSDNYEEATESGFPDLYVRGPGAPDFTSPAERAAHMAVFEAQSARIEAAGSQLTEAERRAIEIDEGLRPY